MPVTVLAPAGSVTSSSVARGIDWAVASGADVINMSLGADCPEGNAPCSDFQMDAAIERAADAGVILIASSGNSGLDRVGYPAVHPDVIAVGASTSSDDAWSGSNGGTDLDLVAPGVSILQEGTVDGRFGYYFATGTSMAAPHVAAVAAHMLSANPSLDRDDVRSMLRSTANDLGPSGYDTTTGWGRLDAEAAYGAAVASTLPCAPTDTCDSVAAINGGGFWSLWDELAPGTGTNELYP
jgi:subtilisin family serine protease